MWTIGSVKQTAREKLSHYYGASLFVTLIWSAMNLASSGSSGSAGEGSAAEQYSWILSQNQYLSAASIALLGLTASLIALAAVLFHIFVLNPVEVGYARYFAESHAREESAGAGRLFWAFGSGYYLNVVKILFLRDLYTFLWTLLLVVPGIVKAYEYYMIPYILSENPEADSRDVFALSKDMMNDNKLHMFGLELSFIGWLLLGAAVFSGLVRRVVPFGYTAVGTLILTELSIFFIRPYMSASYTEVYYILRGGISGFPFNGFGVPEVENVCQQQMNQNGWQ